MSWIDLVLPDTKAKSDHAQVVVACGKRGRFTQALRVVVRDELLDGGLPWWRAGQWVRVQLGTGEHAGQMRLSPAEGQEGPKQRLVVSGGKRGRVVLSLRGYFPLPPDAQSRSVEFDHADGWLELTLPSWARAPMERDGLVDPKRGPGRPKNGTFEMGAMAIPQRMRP